ncbi:MAG: BON domain-containing protein [Candidatus Brocadiia bacterium]
MPVADEDIKRDAVDQLYWDSRIDASDVTVSVDGGIVTLSGTVSAPDERRAAVGDVCAIAGVLRVNDELSVRHPEGLPLPDDAEILNNVQSILSASASVDSSGVRVSVDAGIVTLEGTVNAYWHRAECEEMALGVWGVVEVENDLAVVPTEDVEDKAIAEDIVAALERSAEVDAEDITVEVDNGVVTLEGTVPDWAAHEMVRDAARYTRGVRQIDDELAVMRPEQR